MLSYEETHQVTKKICLAEFDRADPHPEGANPFSAVLLLLYLTTTIGSDNPSSRYPSLSHTTPHSHFMEERQAMRSITGLIRSWLARLTRQPVNAPPGSPNVPFGEIQFSLSVLSQLSSDTASWVLTYTVLLAASTVGNCFA